MRRVRPAIAGGMLLAGALAGCGTIEAPDLPPPAPIALLATVSDPASRTGQCLLLSQRVVTGRSPIGFTLAEIRPTGRQFCPAPGVLVWDQPPAP